MDGISYQDNSSSLLRNEHLIGVGMINTMDNHDFTFAGLSENVGGRYALINFRGQTNSWFCTDSLPKFSRKKTEILYIMMIKKIKILMILSLIVFYSCSNDDEFLNSYEVDITFDGEVSEFIQILSLASSRNDGNGNFKGEKLLFQDSGKTAPSIFTNEDLVAGTYSFVTARPAENLQINYTNEIFIGLEETTNDATMNITVVIKRDGTEIDNFTLSYDESTGDEEFFVTYDSDNSGFRCYCAVNCDQLLGPGGLGPAVPCD